MCGLSIIVPVYNVCDYLEECLNSILNQTYQDWEMIIIDDGSTDGSERLCDKFTSGKIKVFHQSNSGLSAARNLGLKHATGKYIGFVDSDDVILLNYYQNLIFLAEENQADIVCSVISAYGKKQNKQNVYYEILDKDEAMKQLIIQNKFNHGVCVKLFNKEIAQKVNFEIGYTSEDVLYSYNAFKIAQKIVFTNYSGYLYRVRNDSITTSSFTQKNFDLYKIMLKIKEDIKISFPYFYTIFNDKFFYCKLYYLKKSIELNNYKSFECFYAQIFKGINFSFLKFAFTKSRSIKLFFKCLFLGFLPKPLILKLPFNFVTKLKKYIAAVIHNESTYKKRIHSPK